MLAPYLDPAKCCGQPNSNIPFIQAFAATDYRYLVCVQNKSSIRGVCAAVLRFEIRVEI